MRAQIDLTGVNGRATTKLQLLQLVGLIYITLNLMGSLYLYRFVESGGQIIMSGLFFLLPAVFLIEDIVAELYGYKIARSLLWLTLVCSTLFCFFSVVVTHHPVATVVESSRLYVLLLDPLFRVIPSAMLALSVGRFIDITLFTNWLAWINAAFFWIRCGLSTMVGVVFSLFIFLMMTFWGAVPYEAIFKLFQIILLIRLLYAAVSHVVVVVFVAVIRKNLSIEDPVLI